MIFPVFIVFKLHFLQMTLVCNVQNELDKVDAWMRSNKIMNEL